MRPGSVPLLLVLGALAGVAAERVALTVGPLGADFPTVQAAIDAVPADNAARQVIVIQPGAYFGHTVLDKPNVTLRGFGPATLLTYNLGQAIPGTDGQPIGWQGAAALLITAEATGAVIILVHHAGKDLHRGSRGWSGIKAAADAELEVIKHENGQREIRISKMKDGDDGLSWGFKLEVLEVGLDDDGEAITSCVAVEAELPKADADDKPRKGVKKLGRVEAHIMETLETQVDPFVADMPMSDFVQLCVDGMPAPEPNKRDVRRQDVIRALRSLTKGDSAPLEIKDGMVIFMIS